MGPQRRVSSPRISIRLKLGVCDLGNMNGHNMKMGINDGLSLILFLLLLWETMNEEFKGERLMFLGLWFQHIMARQATWQSRGRLRTAMDKERKTQLASLTQRWVQSTVTEPPSKPDISAIQFTDQVSFCPECTIQYVRGSLETEILPVFSI